MGRGRGRAGKAQAKARGGRPRTSPSTSVSTGGVSKPSKRLNPTSPRELRQISRAADQKKRGGARSRGRSGRGRSVGRSSGRQTQHGDEAVGRRVQVYWPTRSKWMAGEVAQFNADRELHLVRYSDGEEQWLAIAAKENNRRLKWLGVGDEVGAGSGFHPGSGSEGAEDEGIDFQDDDVSDDGTDDVKDEDEEAAQSQERQQGGASFSGRRDKQDSVGGARKDQRQTPNAPDTDGDGSNCSAGGTRGDGTGGAIDTQCNSKSAAADASYAPHASKTEERVRVSQTSPAVPNGGLAPSAAEPAVDGASPTNSPADAAGCGTEAEVRARAEKAWLRTYEALNKAVRLIKLAREGAPGDAAAAVNGNAGGKAGDRKSLSTGPSPLASPTGRKSTSGFRKSNGGRVDGPSREDVIKSRVSLFWPGDNTYYKGKIKDFNREKDMHCILYDDGEEEWINLSDEKFIWLGPRGKSGGYSQAQAAAVMALDPEGHVSPTAEQLAQRYLEAESNGPLSHQAVGWRLSVLWDGDGKYYDGEVLAYNPANRRHHILFDDGEEEWMTLSKEDKRWRHKCRGQSRPAGIASGHEMPRGRAAIGWRIGVYWKDDMVFYGGEIRGYDSSTGKHHIHYDDNEDEFISLSTEKIRWMIPPGAPVRKSEPRRKTSSSSARPVKKASFTAIANGVTSSSKPSTSQGAQQSQQSADAPKPKTPAPQPMPPAPTATVQVAAAVPLSGAAVPPTVSLWTAPEPQQTAQKPATPPRPPPPTSATPCAVQQEGKRSMAPSFTLPLPDNAVSRQVKKGAVLTAAGSRLSLSMEPQAPVGAKGQLLVAPSMSNDDFEDFLQIHILGPLRGGSHVAKQGPPAPSAPGNGAKARRMSQLSRMLWRAAAGEESTRLGVPGGNDIRATGVVPTADVTPAPVARNPRQSQAQTPALAPIRTVNSAARAVATTPQHQTPQPSIPQGNVSTQGAAVTPSAVDGTASPMIATPTAFRLMESSPALPVSREGTPVAAATGAKSRPAVALQEGQAPTPSQPPGTNAQVSPTDTSDSPAAKIPRLS